jgi:hypothetical protein
MNTTKRYIHPQEQTILNAMEKAREVKGGHNSGHNPENAAEGPRAESAAIH